MSKKKKTRRRFTEEFKAETVKLVKQSDRSMAGIAMELGISAKSIGEWVRISDIAADRSVEMRLIEPDPVIKRTSLHGSRIVSGRG